MRPSGSPSSLWSDSTTSPNVVDLENAPLNACCHKRGRFDPSSGLLQRVPMDGCILPQRDD